MTKPGQREHRLDPVFPCHAEGIVLLARVGSVSVSLSSCTEQCCQAAALRSIQRLWWQLVQSSALAGASPSAGRGLQLQQHGAGILCGGFDPNAMHAGLAVLDG